MDCPMCGTRQHRRNKTVTRLSFETIRDKLLIPGQRLGFSGFVISGGEPTLASHLLDTINSSVDLGYEVILSTNLLQFNTKRFNKVLVALDNSSHLIQVSFDSNIPSEMNTIRGKDVYDTVLYNCRKILSLREKINTSTRIGVVTVIQHANVNSIIDTVKFVLDDLGFDLVKLQLRHDYYSPVSPENYRHQKHKFSEINLASLLDVSEKIFKMSKENDRILPEKGDLFDWRCFLTEPLKMKKTCMSPISVYIDAYGNFRGCILGEIIGNIHDMGLREYLLSKEYEEFLKFSEKCNICTHGCS